VGSIAFRCSYQYLQYRDSRGGDGGRDPGRAHCKRMCFDASIASISCRDERHRGGQLRLRETTGHIELKPKKAIEPTVRSQSFQDVCLIELRGVLASS